MIEELLEPLVSERFIKEERYRNGHVRIINALPGRRIMGVHVPEMKALAKELVARPDFRDILGGFERAAAGLSVPGPQCNMALAHEETVVWGIMINYMKCPLDERLEYLRKYVPALDNWAVCDLFCSSAKWVMRKFTVNPSSGFAGRLPDIAYACGKAVGNLTARDILWEDLCRYFASDSEFEVRFAVVMAMSYYLDMEWLQKVFSKIDALDFGKIESEYISVKEARQRFKMTKVEDVDTGWADAADIAAGRERAEDAFEVMGVSLGEPPYYVRMGVAWLLATALAKFPDATREYLKHSALPDDVLKLYVRKARESFRTRDVSPFL